MSGRPIVVAITGASGVIYAVRLLQVLAQQETEIHLTLSPSGGAVIQEELGLKLDVRAPDLAKLIGYVPPWTESDQAKRMAETAVEQLDARFRFHRYDDYMTPIASGSFQTKAMVVCPCSGSTLSGIARAAASNLIQRAAEVHLKEHRKLVLVPRETPLSVLQLENMHRLAAAGAVMLPAMPGWYHGVESLDSMVNFVVCRILDQLDVPNDLMKRWGES
ncbi:MAG: UbiX family flavin prenyltransferase [Rubripirellula sp.]